MTTACPSIANRSSWERKNFSTPEKHASRDSIQSNSIQFPLNQLYKKGCNLPFSSWRVDSMALRAEDQSDSGA